MSHQYTSALAYAPAIGQPAAPLPARTGYRPFRLAIHRTPGRLLADSYSLVLRAPSGVLRTVRIASYRKLLSPRHVRSVAGNTIDIAIDDYTGPEWRSEIHRLMLDRLKRLKRMEAIR